MPRPRKADTRNHQLNIRFTARELARVHHHAGLLGKTPADFGRILMLRRPRRRKGKAPVIVTVPEPLLLRWHAIGTALNARAHHFNATGELPASELARLARALRALLKQSFAHALADGTAAAPYALAPLVRYHLRKICTNLVQIADRAQALGRPPPELTNLIFRFRTILNGDSPPHGS